MDIVSLERHAPHMAEARLLLEGAALPTGDLADPGVRLWAVIAEGRVVACIGLEPLGRSGLLRSLVVAPAYRGDGLAGQLCEMVTAQARAEGIETLYLLTEQAAGYFARLGFERIERAQAPAEVAATRQFSSLCPGDATLMRKPL